MNKRSKGFSSDNITEKHVLLLQAYKHERNKRQAQEAIAHYSGRELNFGRHVYPLTQDLIDWGFVKRTNPGSSNAKGHKHIITSTGKEALSNYFKMLDSISQPQPNFGF